MNEEAPVNEMEPNKDAQLKEGEEPKSDVDGTGPVLSGRPTRVRKVPLKLKDYVM